MTIQIADENAFAAAVLHKAGVREFSEKQLTEVLAAGAEEFPEEMSEFALHPVYHDNRVTRGAISLFHYGGVVFFDFNARRYRVGRAFKGVYGKECYEVFGKEKKVAIRAVAKKLKERCGEDRRGSVKA